MEQVAIKTHLIITDIHSEYDINWCGRLIDADPLLENGFPVFILISRSSRVRLNTANVKRIEEVAKSIARPRGREAITKDSTRIYLQEKDNKERLIGVVTHKRIKKYAPMYDKVGYK